MLCFVDDQSLPGITRKRQGRYWRYFGPDGNRITDREEIERLNAVGMPPAYERCWFCPKPDGHVQATGFDAKGRKQYRYHPGFREQQEAAKYERLAAFGRALPKLRKKVEEDMAGKPTVRDTVLAAIVRLIDETRMRIGNESYAKENKSFGATTLRNRHAKVTRGQLKISYTGKHGVKRTVTLTDRNLVRIAKRTQDLPGQNLFEYVNEDGGICPATSGDVNSYIREAMGDAFTAKDFRTWGASTIAFEEMIRRYRKHGKVKLKSVIEPVAEALGNTAAISRKSYVHPALIEAAKDAGAIGDRPLPRASKYLSSAERGLIEFLDALPEEQVRAEAKVDEKGKVPAKAA
ncbi:MAG TPA: DNA topoisomerase IB [Allosphingosinicella sp.]|nr:DNA topoisomerase IB [Allosphingosinicella sp.]